MTSQVVIYRKQVRCCSASVWRPSEWARSGSDAPTRSQAGHRVWSARLAVVSPPVCLSLSRDIIICILMSTLRANPKAPGKELESRTTKVPASLSFNSWIAVMKQSFKDQLKRISNLNKQILFMQINPPSSLVICGLYQYFEVSRTKRGVWSRESPSTTETSIVYSIVLNEQASAVAVATEAAINRLILLHRS